MPVTPTLESLQTAETLLGTPGTKVEQLPAEVVDFFREQITGRINTLTGPKFSPEELQTLAALKSIFDETAGLLAHGISWETIEASLAADKEAIVILGDLIARGGKPTVTMEADGEIKWTEAAQNVPLEDFKGIPMSSLAYDEVGQSKTPKERNCRGNAVDAAKKIHPRVKLASRAESEKLAQAGLIRETQALSWLDTPDLRRGDKNDQNGGLAWAGWYGVVSREPARDCSWNSGARFSLGVKKVEI